MIKWHVIKSNDDLPRFTGKYVSVTKIYKGKEFVDISVREQHGGWRNVVWGEQVIAWAELPESYQGIIK